MAITTKQLNKSIKKVPPGEVLDRRIQGATNMSLGTRLQSVNFKQNANLARRNAAVEIRQAQTRQRALGGQAQSNLRNKRVLGSITRTQQRDTSMRTVANEKRNFVQHKQEAITQKRARNVEYLTNKQQAVQNAARTKARIIAQAQASLRQTNQNLAKNVTNLSVEHAHNIQTLAMQAKVQAQRNLANIVSAEQAARVQAALQAQREQEELMRAMQYHRIERLKTGAVDQMGVQGHVANARQLYGASKLASAVSMGSGARAAAGQQLEQTILQGFLKQRKVKKLLKKDAGMRKFVKFTNPKKKIGQYYSALPPRTRSMFVGLFGGVRKKKGFAF